MSNRVAFSNLESPVNGVPEIEAIYVDRTNLRSIESRLQLPSAERLSDSADRILDKVSNCGEWWHKLKTDHPIGDYASNVGLSTLEIASKGMLHGTAKGLNMLTGALDVAEGFYVDRELRGGSGVGPNFATATIKSVASIMAGVGGVGVLTASGLLVATGPISLPTIAAAAAISAGTKFVIDRVQSYL
jgi:hypothetical protein